MHPRGPWGWPARSRSRAVTRRRSRPIRPSPPRSRTPAPSRRRATPRGGSGWARARRWRGATPRGGGRSTTPTAPGSRSRSGTAGSALGPGADARAVRCPARALAAAVPTGLAPGDGALLAVAGLDAAAAQAAAETIAADPSGCAPAVRRGLRRRRRPAAGRRPDRAVTGGHQGAGAGAPARPGRDRHRLRRRPPLVLAAAAAGALALLAAAPAAPAAGS